MRHALIVTAVMLLCSSASAAEQPDRWRVSILAAEISTTQTHAWADDTRAGLSVGLAYAPTPQWDIELTAASQSHVSAYTRFFYAPAPNGTPGMVVAATEFRRYRVIPADLSVTRHFLVDQAIAPYVRAGVRYVDAPGDPTLPPVFISPYVPGDDIPLVPVAEGFGFRDRTSVQAGAGVRVRLTPRTALRAEATRLLRSDGADFDPLTRFGIGVSWVF
jgi:hypothetical protein